MRSDLHDEQRRLRGKDGFDWLRTHNLWIFLSERQAHPIFFDAPRWETVSTAPRLFQRLCVGRLFLVRHLHGAPGWLGSQATDENAGLRRRDDHLARWKVGIYFVA